LTVGVAPPAARARSAVALESCSETSRRCGPVGGFGSGSSFPVGPTCARSVAVWVGHGGTRQHRAA
jgi:hypothetical protein